MLRNPRNLLWLLPLLLLLTSPLWMSALSSFLRPRGGFTPEVTLPGSEPEQRFVMDTIAITMSSGGKVEWYITAKQAFTGKSDKDIEMVGVDATYTGDDQEKTLISSARGRYDMDKSHLTLIDDVVVDKPLSQQKLFSDLLHYYNDRKTVVCPDKVELRGPDFIIRAGRLEYNLASEGYDFSGRVRVMLGVPAKG